MKVSTGLMSEGSLFFYMMAAAIVRIPAALTMTDFKHLSIGAGAVPGSPRSSRC